MIKFLVNTVSDIWLKHNAFINDLKLPLGETAAHISSLRRGEDVARGYEKVVADGESLWLQLRKDQIYLSNFRKRQKTASRQYWTMNGVTLHHQLVVETGRYPRRHKLAVKLQNRQGPSSKLEAGKWYLHVHQIKIYNQEHGSRWLGTRRLVYKLKKTFGEAYHPRPSFLTTYSQPSPVQPILNHQNSKLISKKNHNHNYNHTYANAVRNSNQPQQLQPFNSRQWQLRTPFPLQASLNPWQYPPMNNQHVPSREQAFLQSQPSKVNQYKSINQPFFQKPDQKGMG